MIKSETIDRLQQDKPLSLTERVELLNLIHEQKDRIMKQNMTFDKSADLHGGAPDLYLFIDDKEDIRIERQSTDEGFDIIFNNGDCYHTRYMSREDADKLIKFLAI